MSKIRKSLSVIGLLFVLSAVAVTLKPGLVSQLPFPVPGNLATAAVVMIIALVFGLYGLKSFRVSSIDDSMLSLQIEEKPEIAKDSNEELKLEFNWQNEKEAREELRKTVNQVLRRQHNRSVAEAEEIISSGEWTDDQVSAAFIDTGIKYPVLERLREWLEEDETLARRLNRAVDAVEELHERGENQ